MQGKVKWFSNVKGFGFIVPEDGSNDIFAHFSQIQMQGYRKLKIGQTVQFDLVVGEKGNHAQNIQLVKE